MTGPSSPLRSRRAPSRRAPAAASLVAAFLFASLPIGPADGADRGRRDEGAGADLLDEIRERARAGGRAEALGLIEQFLAESPRSPLAPRALLLAASIESDASLAARRWERIVADYAAAPESREALLALARYRVASAQYDAAIEALDILLKTKKPPEPAASEGRYWQIVASLGARASLEPLAISAREIRETPWDAYAQLALGKAFLAAGDTDRALERFASAASARGTDAPRCAALFGAAEAYRARGDAALAAARLEEVVRACPETVEGALAAERLRVLAAPPDSTRSDRPADDPAVAVEVGSFGTRAEAERVLTELAARRAEKPRIVESAGTEPDARVVFRVLLGAFRDRAPAEDLARELREDGYERAVVTP
jgi:tetratricopeptide (TPR) repeat protein